MPGALLLPRAGNTMDRNVYIYAPGLHRLKLVRFPPFKLFAHVLLFPAVARVDHCVEEGKVVINNCTAKDGIAKDKWAGNHAPVGGGIKSQHIGCYSNCDRTSSHRYQASRLWPTSYLSFAPRCLWPGRNRIRSPSARRRRCCRRTRRHAQNGRHCKLWLVCCSQLALRKD